MEILVSQVFESKRKLTREEFESLKGLHIVDCGGVQGEYYSYHFHSRDMPGLTKNMLKERFGLEFLKIEVYELENRFPLYQ